MDVRKECNMLIMAVKGSYHAMRGQRTSLTLPIESRTSEVEKPCHEHVGCGAKEEIVFICNFTLVVSKSCVGGKSERE